jgi:hypothetical protein
MITVETQMEGRFEFVSGQLRDIQLYMHAKFGDIEGTLTGIKADVAGIKSDVAGLKTEMAGVKAAQAETNSKLDALPRVLAEMLAKR